jgi:hypothetical protein
MTNPTMRRLTWNFPVPELRHGRVLTSRPDPRLQGNTSNPSCPPFCWEQLKGVCACQMQRSTARWHASACDVQNVLAA